MKKIAIVGVDGSGKTVLMTALGDKYENPDGFGLFLSPENADAFGYVKLQMDRMRHGKWPGSTIAGKSSVLKWGLFRKVEGNNTRLCNLSFLDFSGEVYRMAFGSKSDHDAASYDDDEIASSINELKQHIKDADTLAVLINLKDIISGNVANPRTREAMWLSKSILDYATRKLHTPNIALVFTQADAYRATIESCGGIRGAYEKFLPHVSNIYPRMRLLAVSAVNKTLPDGDGIPCPVDGFQSEGLDDLMEWIVSTIPGCETLISDIKNAPVRCREEAWNLREEYIAVLPCEASLRQGVLDRLAGKLVELDAAMRSFPQSLPEGALGLLQDELQEMRNFEVAYSQLSSNVPCMVPEQIHKGVEELCDSSLFASKQRLHVIDALFAIRTNANVAAARKRRKTFLAIAISILVLGAIAVGVYFVHAKIERQKAECQRIERIAESQRQEAEREREERERNERIAELQRHEAERQREERVLVAEEDASKSKIARGWSYEIRKGHKIAVWKPGAYHSQTTSLKADYEEDKWLSTKPGYVWIGGRSIKPFSEVLKEKLKPNTHVCGVASDTFDLYAQDGVTVSSVSELRAAIKNIERKGIINLKNGRYVGGIEIPSWKDIVLIGQSSSGVVLYREDYNPVNIADDGHLTLINCTVKTTNESLGAVHVDDDGSFTAMNCYLGRGSERSIWLDKNNKLTLYNCELYPIDAFHGVEIVMDSCIIRGIMNNSVVSIKDAAGTITRCRFLGGHQHQISHSGNKQIDVEYCLFDGDWKCPSSSCACGNKTWGAIFASGPMWIHDCKFNNFRNRCIDYHGRDNIIVSDCEFSRMKCNRYEDDAVLLADRGDILYENCSFTDIIGRKMKGKDGGQVRQR